VRIKTLSQNKKKVLAYNHFRKGIFAELAPKDSEIILHLLPWMLSVNDPHVPGYIENIGRLWSVFQIDNDREITSREPSFKRMFGIMYEDPLLKHEPSMCWIEGLYTIGSVGSIAQTSRSDCDIWVCVDGSNVDGKALGDLRRKINSIKDWLDQHIKIPVYFFISDVENIRNCRFGTVEGESSGSAQKKMLKEEFYRTALIIGGKIPLWWVYGPEQSKDTDYETFAENVRNGIFAEEYDLVDLGNIESVEYDEYFGSALWQFNKALSHPLKSVIKMLLLKMLLESPREELLCHRLRRMVLEGPEGQFLDPGTFTLQAMLEYYRDLPKERFAFIMECFYLNYDMKLLSGNVSIREKLAGGIFEQNKMERQSIKRLNEFSLWSFQEQSDFGARIFELLRQIYTDISAVKKDVKGEIEPEDLQVMGGKLSACLENKSHKIPIIHKPFEDLTKPTLVFKTDGQIWQVYTEADRPKLIVESPDIIRCIAYVVWNDIFISTEIRMAPNTTSITLQEIINIGKKMKDLFGTSDIAAVPFPRYLESERIEKALIVVNFESAWDADEVGDLWMIYRNNWGELFVRQWDSPDALRDFFHNSSKILQPIDIQYYVQRNSLMYEKIIERTKQTAVKKFHP